MNAFSKLLKDVVAGGQIDAGKVKRIREEIYADGTIDADEVEFLFDVNDAVSGNDNDPGWERLFVEAITSNILEDGMINAEGTAMLIAKIQGDGMIDAVEKALLLHLKEKTSEFPSALDALLTE